MKIQNRYRTMALAALAISLLAIAGFPQTAWAGANANNARAEMAAEKKAANNGQAKKADSTTAEPSPAANNVDGQAGPTTNGSESGPGGQVCDGDPDNEPGDGGNYENTCDSYPDPNNQGSDNGAGDGKATGKPCEGCVGNADDKNPAGQADSGPSDNNNGYECDQRGRSDKEGNNGVGFGNPAHTGCTSTTTPPPPCDPATDANQCKPCPGGKDTQADGTCVPKCPDGKPMPASGNAADCAPKCPDGKPMPASGNAADCVPKCPDGKQMPASGNAADCTPKCPAGEVMDGSVNGSCSKPCVAGTDAACSQSTPSCVASDGSSRCGGVAASVLGEQLGRLDVLGVSIEAPGAVAPAGLARTGGFQLTGLVQAGLILALAGLGLVVLGRRRPAVDIASRLLGR